MKFKGTIKENIDISEPVETLETNEPIKTLPRLEGVVNVETRLNIRSLPSTSSTVIDKVTNGTILIILEEDDETFYKVELANGMIGYAMKKYIIKRADNMPE